MSLDAWLGFFFSCGTIQSQDMFMLTKAHKRLETNVFFFFFNQTGQDDVHIFEEFLFIRQTNIQTLQLMID